MKLRRGVRLSLNALLARRTRTALAVASVSAGVAAVLLTGALGAGASQAVRANIEGMGANLLVVRPAQVKKFVARKEVKGLVTTLREDDAMAVESLALVAHAAPDVEGPVRVTGGGGSMRTKAVGTTPAFQAVRGFHLRSGRFLEPVDDETSARVAVLGARVADALYAGEDPVGQEIRIRGIPFDIIGVLAAKGVQADGDEDNQVAVPLRTALRRLFNTTWLSTILVSVADDRGMADAEAEIRTLLRRNHRLAAKAPQRGGRVGDPADGQPDDFEIQNAARMFALQQQAADSLRLLTTVLAALALAVGGAGIMGVMLMSVRERTGEIGLRMAVGATRRDVVVQFLFEATVLALGGWVAGLAAASLGAAIIALATTWTLATPVAPLVSSFGMALVIGLGFGALPARNASRIPPIAALVSE